MSVGNKLPSSYTLAKLFFLAAVVMAVVGVVWPEVFPNLDPHEFILIVLGLGFAGKLVE